eukprot:1140225-Pelagomonas_calceolata.AAC.1
MGAHYPAMMDLTFKLPRKQNGHDAILLAVGWLSTMVHLVPTIEPLSALGFMKHSRNRKKKKEKKRKTT